jgi:hypothetical protein
MMVHAGNPSTQGGEAVGSRVQGHLGSIVSSSQPELHSQTLSQKEKENMCVEDGSVFRKLHKERKFF